MSTLIAVSEARASLYRLIDQTTESPPSHLDCGQAQQCCPVVGR